MKKMMNLYTLYFVFYTKNLKLYESKGMQEYVEFIQSHMVTSALWVVLLVSVIVTTVRMMLSKVKVISQQEGCCSHEPARSCDDDVRSQELLKKAMWSMLNTSHCLN